MAALHLAECVKMSTCAVNVRLGLKGIWRRGSEADHFMEKAQLQQADQSTTLMFDCSEVHCSLFYVHVPLMLTTLPGCCATSCSLSDVARGAWDTSTLLPQTRTVGVDRAGGGAGGAVIANAVEGARHIHCRTDAAAATENNCGLAKCSALSLPL